MKYDAVVVASGKGLRANLGYNKVLFKLKNGNTILEEACHLFFEDEDCQKVIVVTNENIELNNDKVCVVNGGEKRADSVMNGLNKTSSEFVLVHDGARPFLTKEDLENLKKEVEINGAAILVKRCSDTVKYSTNDFIEKTIDRNNVYLALTPQGAKKELLINSYKKAIEDNITITDEASALEYNEVKVKFVIGKPSNIKLTNKEDFINL